MDGTEGRKVENIETPIFVPFTKESKLKKRLQEVDRLIGEATGTPACRFVERCGGSTIVGLLGRNNPWALEWECGRKECLVCEGRKLLKEEEEKRQIAPEGTPTVPRPGKEEMKAVPKCTMEGAGYLLECWTCRLEGKVARYVGETSRSPYQRGQEHQKEICEAKRSHPMVGHFLDVHRGQRQVVLMRTVRNTNTALERQVWESVIIDRLSRKEGVDCLNQRSEWGKSRKPFLMNGAGTQPNSEEGKSSGAGNRKRGTYREDGEGEEVTDDQEGVKEVKERPAKRRNRREVPDGQEMSEGNQDMKRQASTPVAVKVRRMEDRIREGKDETEKEKIQPTLRSFISLRSGLMGPSRQPGGKIFPGNQETEGRDLLPGSIEDTYKEFGDIGRMKESKVGKAAFLERYGYTEEGLRPQEIQDGASGNQSRQGMRKREGSGKGAQRMEGPKEE